MVGGAPCYLIQLPPEIRSQVFGFLFQDAQLRLAARGSNTIRTISKHNTNVSILATCKFLRQEAAPMFWSTMELFIPLQMIYDYRNVGLWSHQSLQQVISLKPQIRNINIGIIQETIYMRTTSWVAAISSFVTDLKDFTSLKRLILTHVCKGWFDNSPGFLELGNEILYENMTDEQRQKMWRHIQPGSAVTDIDTNEVPFFERVIVNGLDLGGQFWFDEWVSIYRLIMNWRSDPIKIGVLFQQEVPTRGIEAERHDRKRMSFKIFHHHYQQLTYNPKLPSDFDDSQPELIGYLPPRIHEFEILERDDFPTPAEESMQLVGKHRSFWTQKDPPKRLMNVGELDSLLIDYPFWSF